MGPHESGVVRGRQVSLARTVSGVAAGACLILVCGCGPTVPSHIRSVTDDRLAVLQADPVVTEVARLFGPSAQIGTYSSCPGNEIPPRVGVDSARDLTNVSATLAASIASAGWTASGESQTLPGDYFQRFEKSFGSWTALMEVSLSPRGSVASLYTTQSDTCVGWLADTVPSPSASASRS
jgi:hypothetical protein